MFKQENIKMIVFILIAFFFFKDAHAQTESYYQDIYCDLRQGQKEVILSDKTRVDCVTPEGEAIEIDFASKWAECIGQALYYAAKTDKIPVCLLIGNKKDYDKYSARVRKVIKYYKLPLQINWIEK